VLALGAAVAVLTARSLVSACVSLAALCACAAAAVLALGYGDAALALALLGVGVAPVMLLAGVLLSSRAVKPRRAPWLSIAAAAAAGAAMLSAAPELDCAKEIAAPREPSAALAALVFVAVAAAVALLGYGERGVLGGKGET
jgi:hypothetical protein